MLGYEREGWGIDSWDFMKIGTLLRGARLHDVRNDTYLVDDRALFRTALKEVIPRLLKKPPFFLFLFNIETHWPFLKCQIDCNGLRKDYKHYYRCFTCFDTILEEFIEGLRALKLKDTEVVIFGDHLVIRDSGVFSGSRKLAMIFPFREKKVIDKEMSYYDVLPTILDLLDIEAAPRSPWGVSMNSGDIGSVPSSEDLTLLARMFESVRVTDAQWGKRSTGMFDDLQWKNRERWKTSSGNNLTANWTDQLGDVS
jgi:hypothetical protein